MAVRILIQFLSSIALTLYGCNDLFEDESFLLTKTTNTSLMLRTDGYYYGPLGIDSWCNVLIFYKNGIMIDGGAYNNLSTFEESCINGTFNSVVLNKKHCWGLYKIDSLTISIENVIPFGGLNRIAIIKSGNILDEKSFSLYKEEESWNEGTEEEIDITYYFVQFSPKPDSINPWIK